MLHLVFSRWQVHIAGLQCRDVTSALGEFDRLIEWYEGGVELKSKPTDMGELIRFSHNHQVAMAFMVAHHGLKEEAVERLERAANTARAWPGRTSALQEVFANVSHARLLMALGRPADERVLEANRVIARLPIRPPELYHAVQRLNKIAGGQSHSLVEAIGAVGIRGRTNYLVFPKAGVS
jgi:hypothetical protein